jgi:Tol biopolymer transport system component
LVFSSAVGGQTDLWMVDRDGRNARQLTADPAAERQPVITPDGTSVVFVGNRQGQEGIWRLNLASGVVTRVTDNGTDVYPQCLPDNRTVIFTRADGAALRVFRAPLEGGPAALMTDVEMFSTALSRDGRRLAATVLKPATRILVTPLDNLGTGPRLDIASAPVMLDFAPRGDVLTFLETHKGSPQLWNQPLDGGPPRLLLDLHGERIFSFAWSPEGRLAVAHGPVPTDVVLVTVQ